MLRRECGASFFDLSGKCTMKQRAVVNGVLVWLGVGLCASAGAAQENFLFYFMFGPSCG